MIDLSCLVLSCLILSCLDVIFLVYIVVDVSILLIVSVNIGLSMRDARSLARLFHNAPDALDALH